MDSAEVLAVTPLVVWAKLSLHICFGAIFESSLANSVSGRFLFVCQEHAYPADELMPLSCQGRYRGTQPSRGDIDDALGK